MLLYPIPGGGWAGTEADWKKAMKAAGLDPKDFEATKRREVPTDKKGLMEFLTFFAVDTYRLPAGATTERTVDVDELRRQHNPDAAPHVDFDPRVVTATAERLTGDALAQAFAAAPIKLQAELAVGLIDRLTRD